MNMDGIESIGRLFPFFSLPFFVSSESVGPHVSKMFPSYLHIVTTYVPSQLASG